MAKKPGRRPPPGIKPLPAVAPPNVWAEPRNLFFFRTGRLRSAETESVCEVIALAESGAIVRSPSPPAEGSLCNLELNSAHWLRGAVAWIDEDLLGLEFCDRTEVRDTLSRRETSFPYRAPRLRLASTLEISLGKQRLTVRCHDISESGIKVELPEDRAGAEAALKLTGIGTVRGRVQWWRGGRAGISFLSPIPGGAFTRWLTQRLESRPG